MHGRYYGTSPTEPQLTSASSTTITGQGIQYRHHQSQPGPHGNNSTVTYMAQSLGQQVQKQVLPPAPVTASVPASSYVG
jgi:hypothetical protein